jgi:dihydropteroate synthase
MPETFHSPLGDLGKRTLIMGVLNITPDSFSDGGLYISSEQALRRAVQMAEEGVDIIDIGGESTRPVTFKDQAPLETDEELRRIIEPIKLISRELQNVPISVDTYKSEVANRALDSGASILNDISGLTYDPQMAKVAAIARCPIVLMHILGKPRDIAPAHYDDVVEDILTFFRHQIMYAVQQGLAVDQIILDPGLGFGKTSEHNLTILRCFREFTSLGRPLLVGPSRKSFIGKILGDAAPGDRVEGTAAAVAIAIANGADIVRVHDVKEMKKVAQVADAIVRAFS